MVKHCQHIINGCSTSLPVVLDPRKGPLASIKEAFNVLLDGTWVQIVISRCSWLSAMVALSNQKTKLLHL